MQSLILSVQALDVLLEDVQFARMLGHLAATILMGHLLAWHYMRFARVLSNKRKFARLFVFLAVTTFLVISVVASSLALSLGLVGALSIVRFRTPIKEPIELAYLFLAIAIGIGMGANEAVITVVVYVVILVYLAVQNLAGGGDSELRTVLQVEGAAGDEDPLRTLMPALQTHCSRVDLRRLDRDGERFNASLLLELSDAESAGDLVGRVRSAVPGASVSLIERDALA